MYHTFFLNLHQTAAFVFIAEMLEMNYILHLLILWNQVAFLDFSWMSSCVEKNSKKNSNLKVFYLKLSVRNIHARRSLKPYIATHFRNVPVDILLIQMSGKYWSSGTFVSTVQLFNACENISWTSDCWKKSSGRTMSGAVCATSDDAGGSFTLSCKDVMNILPLNIN